MMLHQQQEEIEQIKKQSRLMEARIKQLENKK